MSFEQAKFYRRQSYKTDLEISRAEHVLNQQLIIEDAHSTKSKKGRINRNRKAERDIERAQAAITAATQQPDADVPLVSPDPIQTVVKPHRRKNDGGFGEDGSAVGGFFHGHLLRAYERGRRVIEQSLRGEQQIFPFQGCAGVGKTETITCWASEFPQQQTTQGKISKPVIHVSCR